MCFCSHHHRYLQHWKCRIHCIHSKIHWDPQCQCFSEKWVANNSIIIDSFRIQSLFLSDRHPNSLVHYISFWPSERNFFVGRTDVCVCVKTCWNVELKKFFVRVIFVMGRKRERERRIKWGLDVVTITGYIHRMAHSVSLLWLANAVQFVKWLRPRCSKLLFAIFESLVNRIVVNIHAFNCAADIIWAVRGVFLETICLNIYSKIKFQ